MQGRWKSARWILLALAAGVALRTFLLFHHSHFNGDTLVYGDIAKTWLRHGVYGQSDGDSWYPTLMRLPGYPAFVAACFWLFGMENYFSILVAQIVFDMAACLLLAAAVCRLFGRSAGLAALWLSSLCIFTATYVVVGLAESLSVFCSAWALYALVRWRECQHAEHDSNTTKNDGRKTWLHLTSLAVALTCALLLRPDNGLLAAAMLPAVGWMAWRAAGLRRAILSLALCTVVFLLALVPWTIRNERSLGVFQPLAPRQANDPGEFVTYGFDKWCGTWMIDYAATEQVYWGPQINPIDIADLPARAFDSPAQRAETAAVIAEYNSGVKNGMTDPPEVDAKFMALANQRIHAHPLRFYLLLPLARLANMWLRPRVEQYDFDLLWWNYPDHPEETILSIALGALNIFYLVLAWVGWRRCRHNAILWALAAFLAMRCLLLLTLDNSEPRYTIVCFPVIFLLGAAAFARKDELQSE